MESNWNLIGFCLACLVLCGCAVPHRAAITTRELRTYQGRDDGLLAIETWTDTEKGGGWFLLTTSDVQSLSAIHTNQNALGGGSVFNAGPIRIKVDQATGQIIEASGSAVGNIVGEALRKAVGVP